MAEKNQSLKTSAWNILFPHKIKEILKLTSDIYKIQICSSEN